MRRLSFAHRRSGCLAACAGMVVIALCLSCGVLVGLFQVWPVATSLPFGYSMYACVGMETSGRWQVGAWWQSPWLSTLPPVFLPNHQCAWLPWLPVLPPQGGVAFPP